MIWTGPGFHFDLDDRVVVMGVLNVTPDSFSDGGRFATVDAALARAQCLADEGADIIDIGGESTRPGSEPVSADAELARVLPVLEAWRERSDLPLSIDTTKAAVAEAALAAGANIVNDVSALADPDMAHVAARADAGLILMHMLGAPKTMQDDPRYDDLLGEVSAFLRARVQVALAAGVAPARLVLDPGIGFGKTTAHNLSLIRHLNRLADLGYPMAIGPSRKRFIGSLTGAPPADRLPGTLAAVALAVQAGARIVRVHDVAAAVQATRVALAVAKAE